MRKKAESANRVYPRNRSRHLFFMLLVVMTVVLSAVPVMAKKDSEAKKTVSANGLVAISLPDDSWKELTSNSMAACFANGSSMIRVDLYKNGDDLPKVASANQDYDMIFQDVVSNQDWVTVTTGYANDRTDYSAISKAIKDMTIVMEEIPYVYEELQKPNDEVTVEDESYTAYVKATELNIREAPGTENPIIAVLNQGDSVNVTGIVKKGGQDVGWVRVQVGDQEGYASSEFIQTTPVDPNAPSIPDTPVTPANPDVPDEPQIIDARTVYLDGSGDPMTLYELSDGTWQNRDGVRYVYIVELDCWSGDDGTTAYDDYPVGPTPEFNTVTVHDDEGEYVTIYQIESGQWTDGKGRFFDYDADGDCWTSEDGYNFWE